MREKTRQAGVTLVEMMVAIAITIAIFAIAGMIFKSTTTAAAKSSATADVSRQIRGLVGQIRRDIEGLRPDLPLAVLFETDGQGNYRDRISFFANGVYSTPDGSFRGQYARLFYGQSHTLDESPSPNPILPISGDPYSGQPFVRHLVRRQKIISYDYGASTAYLGANGLFTPLNFSPVGGAQKSYAAVGITPVDYDTVPFENPYFDTTINTFYSVNQFWKHKTLQTSGMYLNTFLCDDYRLANSWMRRPILGDMTPLQYQPLYLLDDVGSFQIQFWFDGFDRWFPEPRSVFAINNSQKLDGTATADLFHPLFVNPATNSWAPGYSWLEGGLFGFAWNVPENTSDLTPNKIGSVSPCQYFNPVTGTYRDLSVNWRTDKGGIQAIGDKITGWKNVWPRAVKITVKVYDSDRSQYPEGKTHTIIMPLPEK